MNLVNTGAVDRAVRLLVGVALLFVGFSFFTGALQAITLVLGLIMLATGTVGICPLYGMFGINTCGINPAARR